jgi:hypothetical protein
MDILAKYSSVVIFATRISIQSNLYGVVLKSMLQRETTLKLDYAIRLTEEKVHLMNKRLLDIALLSYKEVREGTSCGGARNC